MKRLIYLFPMLLLSCINQSQNIAVNPDDTITYKSQLYDESSSIPYYQCDDYDAFKTNLDTKNVNIIYNGFFKLQKDTIVNRQDSSIIDTIYTYYNNANKIMIYKAVHGDLLAQFDISDSTIRLNGNLRPGITKDYFSKRFGIKGLNKDTVDIGNMEHTFVIRFYFNNDKLRRILIEPYLD